MGADAQAVRTLPSLLKETQTSLLTMGTSFGISK